MKSEHRNFRRVIAVLDPDIKSYTALQAAFCSDFQWVLAASAEDGFRLSQLGSIWLWVIAANLPDIAMADFCTQLRMRDSNARLIVVGDDGVSDGEVACRSAGVPYFFAKPLDIQLFAAVVNQFQRSQQPNGHRPQPRAAPYRPPKWHRPPVPPEIGVLGKNHSQ